MPSQRVEKTMNALILTSGSLMAARILSAWLGAGHTVAALWIGSKKTAQFLRRDRALGRFAPSWSIAALTQRHGFPVVQNPRLAGWTEAESEIARLKADMLITAITHQIVPDRILALFGGRAVNFHPTILPHYRGAAPRIGMLIDGTAELYGGVTLHCLAHGIDEGDIIGVRKVPYEAASGFIDWDVRVACAAGNLVQNELEDYLRGGLLACPQAENEGSYRRVQRAERTLSGAKSALRCKWLCDQFAGSDLLRFRSERGERYVVSRFLGVIGPRTLAKPRIGKHRIEFDAADARVAVARPRGSARFVRLFSYWRAIVRTSRRGGLPRLLAGGAPQTYQSHKVMP